MEKPLVIRVQETETKIINIVNESGLHSYILKNILEKIFNQLNEIELNEIKQYQESLKKEEDKNEKNNKKSIDSNK